MYEQDAFVFCGILVAERQTIATFWEFVSRMQNLNKNRGF